MFGVLLVEVGEEEFGEAWVDVGVVKEAACELGGGDALDVVDGGFGKAGTAGELGLGQLTGSGGVISPTLLQLQFEECGVELQSCEFGEHGWKCRVRSDQ